MGRAVWSIERFSAACSRLLYFRVAKGYFEDADSESRESKFRGRTTKLRVFDLEDENVLEDKEKEHNCFEDKGLESVGADGDAAHYLPVRARKN